MYTLSFHVHAAYKVGQSTITDPLSLDHLGHTDFAFGLHVELSRMSRGLRTGTVLQAENGNRWIVVCRIIHGPAFAHAHKFENETVHTLPLPGFDDIDVQTVSANMIRKEEQGIFCYRIEPIGHSEKPKPGELLHTSLAIQETVKKS